MSVSRVSAVAIFAVLLVSAVAQSPRSSPSPRSPSPSPTTKGSSPSPSPSPSPMTHVSSPSPSQRTSPPPSPSQRTSPPPTPPSSSVLRPSPSAAVPAPAPTRNGGASIAVGFVASGFAALLAVAVMA